MGGDQIPQHVEVRLCGAVVLDAVEVCAQIQRHVEPLWPNDDPGHATRASTRLRWRCGRHDPCRLGIRTWLQQISVFGGGALTGRQVQQHLQVGPFSGEVAVVVGDHQFHQQDGGRPARRRRERCAGSAPPSRRASRAGCSSVRTRRRLTGTLSKNDPVSIRTRGRPSSVVQAGSLTPMDTTAALGRTGRRVDVRRRRQGCWPAAGHARRRRRRS